ncbi:hypothetical protein IG631_15606 [Alternaria alternata]|nr:hypothetical protein IG631_15606 [Alternaria alternata]
MSPSPRIKSPGKDFGVTSVCREIQTGSRVQVFWKECDKASLSTIRVVFARSDAQSRLEYALGGGGCSRGNRSG